MKEMSVNKKGKNEQQTLNDTLLMFKKVMKETKESIDELVNDLNYLAEANNGNIVDVNDIARQVFGEIDEEEKK